MDLPSDNYQILRKGCIKMDLKDSSQIPLYSQLKQAIKEDIRNDKYKIGEQLPTEMELCEEFNVSRVTVRRAIQELVQEKVLYRKQGKGTFVSEAKIKRELVSLGGFSDVAIQSGQEPSSQILKNRVRKAGQQLAELFNIDSDSEILELKRILSINNKPLIIEKSYYPIAKFPNLEAYIGENVSTYKVLKDYYRTDVVKANKTLDIILSDAEQSTIFNCDLNSVMYLLKKKTFSTGNEVIHVSESVIPSSKVTFTFSVSK